MSAGVVTQPETTTSSMILSMPRFSVLRQLDTGLGCSSAAQPSAQDTR